MFDSDSLVTVLIVSFTLTVIIELLFAALLKVRSFKDFLNIFLVNLITNPIVVSVINLVDIKCDASIVLYAIIGMEVLAIISEALIYYKVLKYRHLNPIVLSLVLNALSFFIVDYINVFIYY